MDLLPKSHSEFSSREYWDRFFRKRGNDAFEWYGEYPELCGILHKYMKPADNVLVVGCGNSQLSGDLYDVGYRNISNIDISDVVIRQMTEKNAKKRPDMKFLKMDITQMEFSDAEFGAVLDKGTLDALMTSAEEEVVSRIDSMFAEIGRVLKVGGRYICISLAQEHILDKVLDYFPKEGWMVRVHRVHSEKEDREFALPVMVFIFTKFRKLPNMKQVFEVSYFEEKVERVDTSSDVKKAVQCMQQYAIIRHNLNKKQVEEDVSLDLYSAESSTPRYTLHVVDSPGKCAQKFAIFIVPEGRETEWLFSTTAGRIQVADNVSFSRLVIVTLHRNHTYESLDAIKAELSSKVLELAPPGLGKQQVPFLSVGSDIGNRTTRHSGSSAVSGDYVVEDVELDGNTYRRLIFLDNKNVIQSEARLVKERRKGGGKKKKSKLVVDASHLICEYHHAMVGGLALLHNCRNIMAEEVRVLIIGLGGGGLPLFIHENYPKVYQDVVDIDASVRSVAREWFDFVEDERMKVHVEDGIDFIQKAAKSGSKYHVVMFDIDSKDKTVGMSCPPLAFVEKDFLKTVDSMLHPEGLFMFNMTARDSSLREKVLADVRCVFPTLFNRKFLQDVNEITFCLPSPRSGNADSIKQETLVAAAELQQTIRKHSGDKECSVDLCKQMKGLKLL